MADSILVLIFKKVKPFDSICIASIMRKLNSAPPYLTLDLIQRENGCFWPKTVPTPETKHLTTQLMVVDPDSKLMNNRFLEEFIFEGGYSILLPQTKKKGFFDPPERVMVLWPNRLSWEYFRWYFPTPQCQIAPGIHVAPTRVGQSSELGKNGLKTFISL